MIRIEIHTASDAFRHADGGEVVRILRELADQIERGEAGRDTFLSDLNGNVVGFYRTEEEA